MLDSIARRFRSSSRTTLCVLFLLCSDFALPPPALAAQLIVQVRTDLMPNVELGWVRSRFFELEGDGSIPPGYAVMDRWHEYSPGDDWAAGVRVGESLWVPHGEYRGDVTIYNSDGGLVLSRPVRARLLESTLHVITVLMTAEPGASRPQPGFLPGWELSHWTSEEDDNRSDLDIEHSKDPIQCPVNHAVSGLGCDGDYCDNVRLYCRAVPGMWTNSHNWTPYFSNESGSYEGCNPGQFATGLQCKGQFCDDIRLRCTDSNGLAGICYVTDPISEDNPFTEFIDPTNGYVRRILCEGDNCDDKRLEICRISNFPLNLGAFSDLCVTSVAGVMLLLPCESGENEENISQVWNFDPQVGQLINPKAGTCLTAIGGAGPITEELCAEAWETNWFKDAKGRFSSVGPNNDLLCLSVADMQDPLAKPPIGAALELAACTDALYQLFEPSNAALPLPLPEYDAGIGEAFPLPALLMPGVLVLIGVVSTVGGAALRRKRARK